MKFQGTISNNQIITKKPVFNRSKRLQPTLFLKWGFGDWNLFGYCILAFGICLLCFAPFLVYAAQSDSGSVFREANTSYRTGDYANAAKLYESLCKTDPHIAAFYYNLANAYVRLGKLSHAILNYEKALRLDPRNGDVLENLRYTRGLLEYRVEDTRNWHLKAGEAVLKYAAEREIYAVVFAVLFVFLTGGILYFLYGRGVFWNPWQRVVFMVLVLTALVALGKRVQSHVIREAIVMQKECEARYGPSEHDQAAFRMGEGIKVFVMDRREDWSRVLLTNGESGWVKDSEIAEVKL